MVGIFYGLYVFVKKNTVCISAFILAFLFYTGIITVYNPKPYISLVSKENIISLDGRICSNPVRVSNGKYYRCSLELSFVYGSIHNKYDSNALKIYSQAKGLIYLFIPSKIIEAHYPGRLFSISNPQNSSNPVLIENNVIIKAKGSLLKNNSQDSKEIPCFFVNTLESEGFDNSFWGKLSYFRALSRLQFKRLMYNWGDSGGLLLALISGSGEYTDSKISSGFRDAGLSHILALSGMHLSFFSMFALVFTRFAGKKFSEIFSLFIILLFSWFAGLTPSLFRALLCALLVFITSYLGCKTNMVKILCSSFLIHVCIRPMDLFQLSFQLSYSALLGILLVSNFFDSIFYRIFHPGISSSLCASLGAQVTTLPICLSAFGKFMPIGIIASVIVSPLVLFFLGLGVICIVLTIFMPCFSEVLGLVLNLMYNCIVWLVLFFAGFPAMEI